MLNLRSIEKIEDLSKLKTEKNSVLQKSPQSFQIYSSFLGKKFECVNEFQILNVKKPKKQKNELLKLYSEIDDFNWKLIAKPESLIGKSQNRAILPMKSKKGTFFN